MVFIVLPNGKSFALDVNPNTTTLHHLKTPIEEHHGTPALNQCLFLSQSLGGNDSDLISNLGIGHVPSYGGTTTPSAIPSNIRSAYTISAAVKEGGKGVKEAEEKVEDKEAKEKNKKNFWDIIQGAERENIERQEDAFWKSYREGIELEREKNIKDQV